MIAPSVNRSETLKLLRATKRDLISAAWLHRLKGQPVEVRQESAHKLLDVEQAILALGNVQLADIRESLVANEKELLDGRAALEDARLHLDRVEAFLSKVGAVLATVGKVVKFVTTL